MNKLLIPLFSILILFNSYGYSLDTTICVETDAQNRDGIIYLPNKTKPFTGETLCKNENGQIKSKGKLKNGKLDGKETWWYENGQIMHEGNYKDGIHDGKVTRWYGNGQKMDESFYKDQWYHGKQTQWYENGQIKQMQIWEDGKPYGKWTMWHENGQIKLEGSHIDSKKEGIWTGWFKNGKKLEERYYKENELNRLLVWSWYENGQIESKKDYKIDHNLEARLNGKFTFWYENGQKFIDGSYKDEKPDSKWTFWKKNGQKDKEENYKDGDLVDKTIFKYSYLTGRSKSEKKFKDGKCISGC